MGLRREYKKLLFIVPSILGILTFYLFPLSYCFLFAFSNRAGRFAFGGLVNYISLFESESFRKAFGNTYFLMLLCIGILFLLSLVFIYFLDASEKNLACLVIFSLPMLLPPTLIVKCISEFTLPPRLVLVLIFLWKYIGFHLLLLKATEKAMCTEWTDAAALDGTNKWQMFVNIKFPYLWPYYRFLLIFDGICFFRLFRESYLLYGRYPTEEVYTIIHFFFNNFQNLNYQRLSAAAIVALVPLLVLNGILLKVGKRHEMV